jgi:hypothetical protein
MAARPSQQQLVAVEDTLGAADGTKVLAAAPGANKRIVVVTLQGSVIVSAASACDIESGDGVIELIRFGASPGLHQFTRMWIGGFPLPLNQPLIIQPDAPGPSVHATAEYYIEGKQ